MNDVQYDPDSPSHDADREELEALRAENVRLRAEMGRGAPRSALRTVATWVFVVLASVGIMFSSFTIWLATTMLDTDTYIATIAPLPKDDDVAAAVSARIVDDLMPADQVEATAASILPADLSFLAAPVADAARGAAQSGATKIIQSDAFSSIWQAANRIAHQATVTVLRGGRGGPVSVAEGTVVLDLGDLVTAIVGDLGEFGTAIVGQLPEDAGTIVLYEDDQLAAAQAVVSAADRLRWVFPIVTLLLIVAAFWVSQNRRKTIAYLGVGAATVMAVELIMLGVTRSSLFDELEPASEAAAASAWDILLRGLYQQAWAVLVVGLLLAFGAWLFGPSDRADSVRTWVSDLISRWQDPEAAPEGALAGFLAENRRLLQIGAAVLAFVVFLALSNPTIVSVIILALLLVGVVVAIEVLAGPEQPEQVSQVPADAD